MPLPINSIFMNSPGDILIKKKKKKIRIKAYCILLHRLVYFQSKYILSVSEYNTFEKKNNAYYS